MRNPFQLFTAIYELVPDNISKKNKIQKFIDDSKYVSPELSADIYQKFHNFLEHELLPVDLVLKVRAKWMFEVLALFSKKTIHEVKWVFYESTEFYNKKVNTAEELNSKYAPFLGYRHYGLDIHNEKVIHYLDSVMETLVKIVDFEYYQIKLKFNYCRFYVSDNISHELCISIEDRVNKILKDNK